MSIIRKGNVALSNLRNTPVAHHCRMSLGPKKGHVAVSILGVYTHNVAGH